jgi:hypothetical protein
MDPILGPGRARWQDSRLTSLREHPAASKMMLMSHSTDPPKATFRVAFCGFPKLQGDTLARLIAQQPDMVVVARVPTAEELSEQAGPSHPHVVLTPLSSSERDALFAFIVANPGVGTIELGADDQGLIATTTVSSTASGTWTDKLLSLIRAGAAPSPTAECARNDP